MTITFNDEYLNRTANKWPRPASLVHEPGCGYLGTLWHETGSPDPSNPRGTLNYNLPAKVKSSYDYLIDIYGGIWRYIDSKVWTSYHAGASSWRAPNGTLYRNYALNERLISVELDGKNDGTPVTPAQMTAAAQLALYLREAFLIPLDRRYHPEHKEVAPGRKTDPRGYTADQVLARAHELVADIMAVPLPVQPQMVYLRTTAAANLRQGPARSFPVVRVLPAGDVAGYDGDTIGESIGGNNVWKHAGDQTGFVHSSLLVPA